MKILCNILSKPDEPKVRSIRSSKPQFVDAVGRHAGGVDFLLASGFAVDGDMLHLASESSDVLQNALRVLHDEADDLRIDLSARPQVQVPSSLPAPAFDAYQPLITRMQAQPRGASITEMRLDDLKKKQDALLASSTPARQTRILFPHELQHATLTAPTTGGKSDAQLLAQALKARQDAAEKSQSFRTLAMRELDDLQRRSVYQEAVLRVRFPDKVVLQAVFHPNEPLQAVADHVARCLATPRGFYLYTTPPMTKLDGTKSLLDLNLVPASNLFLGWTTSSPTPTTELGAYLNQDILDDVGAESKDDDDRPRLLYPSSQPLVPSSNSSTTADAKTTTTTSTSTSGARTKGRPGWLKL
ncbi:hypothetical protein SPRG_17649 [Saprolegnia parasitica CBS 223.65]|uniref:UBX domain-containing protein n=1 Tax=Saprolegnia parasitica (strain CBS 223.65) TaxID=695850 RepID=A0A067BER1_SAPPC|nr:hypothetical protein SPRG_17649 [Saprolegnia parasitica CBS 223.65]KDO16874.1 hypothetical protein SPRG_17649 [Saprolegnia parasitica CBS 223.65]|eukprot:XP_012212419.1 hypothetical protein SPRG_17649 [Saprolegnia parasitica CBS 223.65]